MQQQSVEQWAIVELFGNTRIAGRIGEYSFGGGSFVRVDVPELPSGGEKPPIPGFTRLYGQGAIYSISFVDQQTAMAAAREIRAALRYGGPGR